MKDPIPNYLEGYADLELGGGFFRPDSILARDFSVLIASMQLDSQGSSAETFRWLDLMSGCGIRALRWGLEAAGEGSQKKHLLKKSILVGVQSSFVNT